jgi:uncharacterized protein YecE (DUF72 family)
MTLPLFDSDDEAPPPRAARLASALRTLAGQNVYIGTSSWKYEGWLGQIYTREKYLVRGKFSRKKFEAECLREYAATFPVVCGDFSFYQFPTADYWERLFRGTPASLLFAFKAPEEITVETWPSHARYGLRAGQSNERFLDATLFERAFAQALAPYRDRVTTLIFEFGTFSHKTFAHVADFLDRLAQFLPALPTGFRYAVEVRNPEYLSSDYFATLAGHNVAHVFSAWTRMPSLGEQISLPDAFTADFTVVRALLRKGRKYEEAVKMFEPYERAQRPETGIRDAMRQIVDRAVKVGQPAFVFVNNRLEGNAPETIEAVVLDNDDAGS